MRLPIRSWAIASGLLALGAGCGGHGTAAPAPARSAPKPVPVTVAPVERRTVDRTVEVVGTLRGWEDVTIGSKRIGRVVKTLHDMGDRVDPGELLVELETIDADLAVMQAERQLQAELARLGLKEIPKTVFEVTTVPSVIQARVTLERAKQYLNRERSLIQRGAGTSQDYQNAENDEKAAEAGLENAMLTARAILANAQATYVALDVARQARRDMEIRAPVPSGAPPGVTGPIKYAIAKRSVAEGQMLRQGDPVVELVIENPLRLWTNVPERYSSQVKIDQPVRITVASHPGKTFEGTVTRINPSVDPVSRTFQVESAVPNASATLRPGGFAKASILTDRSSEALVVPIDSIVQSSGVTKLFVVDGDHARAIPVETGLEGAGWVEVTSPLPERARVVTTGQNTLASLAKRTQADATTKEQADQTGDKRIDLANMADGTPLIIVRVREPELAAPAPPSPTAAATPKPAS